jgi:hypothetical protein
MDKRCNIDVIRGLINNREDKNIDFKEKIDFTNKKQKNRLALYSVAFANAEGGTIIVGVVDRTREVKGMGAPFDHDQVVQSITDLTDPPVDVSVDSVEIDGDLVGIIKISRGTTVHRLRNDRTVYIRRDGINYKATSEEIVQLYNERDYSTRVYLSEPEKLQSCDNGLYILPGANQPYRKISKSGGLEQLAESPVFLPEFSRWISAPEFGKTEGSVLVSYPIFERVNHKKFIEQVAEVESQLSTLSRYLELGASPALYWSISSDGCLCYGCGSDTLLRAFEDGELGVISIAACGDFRGSDQQRSLLLLISGYCKAKMGDMTIVQDQEIRLYLSFIPFSTGWFRALFSPFVDEDKIPFDILSYELVHPRLRVWRSVVRRRILVPIRGIIRRYKYPSIDTQFIGAAVADTNWFNPGFYRIETEWRGGNVERDQELSERIFKKIERENEIRECPVGLLSECIVSLTNPVKCYDDIESRETTHFYLPLIKHLELDVIGHTVHVLGLNSSPK